MNGMKNKVNQKSKIQFIIWEIIHMKTCSALTPGLHSCCCCSRVAMPSSTWFDFSHCSSGAATAAGSLWYGPVRSGCCCFRVIMSEEFAQVLNTCCQHGWHPATVEFWLIWAGLWPGNCATKSLNFQMICFYYLRNMFSLSKKFICKFHTAWSV